MGVCAESTYQRRRILLTYGSSLVEHYNHTMKKDQAMKKLLLVFLALGSMFALSACPDSGDGGEGAATTESTSTEHSEGGSGH